MTPPPQGYWPCFRPSILNPPSLPLFQIAPKWGTPLIEDPQDRKRLLRDDISRFPPGSAPGPSGLRPRHLQDILQGDPQGVSSLLQGLALLSEACETGNLPMAAV